MFLGQRGTVVVAGVLTLGLFFSGAARAQEVLQVEEMPSDGQRIIHGSSDNPFQSGPAVRTLTAPPGGMPPGFKGPPQGGPPQRLEGKPDEKKSEDEKKPDGDSSEKKEGDEDEGDEEKPSGGPTTRSTEPDEPPDPEALKVRPNEEGMVRFNFKGHSWPSVLEWIADISEMSLDWQELPEGYLNLITRKKYTVAEARDMINRHLLARGFTMLLDGEVISVFKIEKINPGMVPRVTRRNWPSVSRTSSSRCRSRSTGCWPAVRPKSSSR